MTTPMTFEELLPLFCIKGHFHLREFTEGTSGVPGSGPEPTNIIQINQNWGVDVHWSQSGGLCHLMAGSYHLRLYLEKMGGGEFTLGGSGMKSVPFVSAPHTYSESMTIGAHTVPAGVYIAVLALTMKGPLGVPGPIAAFGRKQQMVQFYESGV